MLRGCKSRNKVSVGEPAEGSLPVDSDDSQWCNERELRLELESLTLQGVRVSLQRRTSGGLSSLRLARLVWYSRDSVSRLSYPTKLNETQTNQPLEPLLAADHLADGSMKNVANYVNQCKLHNSRTLELRTHIAAKG